MPYRPPASAAPVRHYKTKPLQIKPLRIKSSPVHSPIHSLALATREGGIGTRVPSPAHWTPAQKRAANALVSGYEGGSRIGALGHVLDSVGRAYTHNPIYRNPIVGKKGALGGLEDLVKGVDPITMGQTLKRDITHPGSLRPRNPGAEKLTAAQAVKRYGLSYSVIGKIGSEGPKDIVRGTLDKAETSHEAIARSIGTMKKLEGKHKAMYSEELRQRIARGEAAKEKAGGGVAGEHAFLHELRGPLPRTFMSELMNGRISQQGLDEAVNHVDLHPDLSVLQKRSVNKALENLVNEGRTPTKSEIRDIEVAFGPEAGVKLRGFRPGQFIVDVANIPRSLMASIDVSAPFRQGLVGIAGHPIVSSKAFGPMFKSLVSERYYQDLLGKIDASPYAAHHEVGGLAISRLQGLTSKNREEQFSSQYAETLTGGKYSPVRASGRAYTAFLDTQRVGIFDSLLKAAEKKGSQRVLVGRKEGGGLEFGQQRPLDINDPALLKSLGNYVNAATGRGKLPGQAISSAAPFLNTIFFSPRLAYSRINFLDPTWYLRGPEHGGLDAFARRQAVKSILSLGTGATAALMLAGHYTRASIGSNPLSADFAKLKSGNTRVDILGGFQQYIRLLAQLQQGKILSSTTGKELNLGKGYGQMSRRDIMLRFIEGKFAPIPSLIDDLFKGTTFAGAPLSVKNEIYSRVIPLVAQDAYDLYKSGHNVPLALAGYGLSAFGIGMQTYGPKKPKQKKLPNPFLDTKPTESKSNPYMPGSSSGSGSTSFNPYMP